MKHWQADGYDGKQLQSVWELAMLQLRELWKKRLPPQKPVDLLILTIESTDLEVRQFNDWTGHRLSIVEVEDGELVPLLETGSSRVVNFLAEVGYAPYW